MPPWVPKRAKQPSGRPGNGNPQGPMRGANGTNGQPGRHRGPPRGKRQVFTIRSSDLFGTLTKGVV